MQITTLPQALERIDYLEEEVLVLKRELGLQRSAEATSRLIAKWKLTPIEARLLEHLTACRGRISSKEGIMCALYSDRVDEPEIKIVDVLVCKIRKKLDFDVGTSAIKTEWARGYRLTPEALAMIDEVMATPMSEIIPGPTPPPRPKRTNLQHETLAAFAAKGDLDIPGLAAAMEITYGQAHNNISVLRKSDRVKVVDWRRMPNGKKRTIYAITDRGRAYARSVTPVL